MEIKLSVLTRNNRPTVITHFVVHYDIRLLLAAQAIIGNSQKFVYDFLQGFVPTIAQIRYGIINVKIVTNKVHNKYFSYHDLITDEFK